MRSTLSRRGLRLEDAFFREQDARLIEQRRALEHRQRTEQELAEVSGIRNAAVLKRLVELEISPDLLASLAVVPLVEVAWADGRVDAREREAVLTGAAKAGIGRQSTDYALLENWLTHRPPARLLDAWTHYVAGLCEELTDREREALRADLLARARRVAEAAGGFLGLTSPISPCEEAVLKTMNDAFASHGRTVSGRGSSQATE